MVDNFDFSQTILQLASGRTPTTCSLFVRFDGHANMTFGNVNYIGNFINGKICGHGSATISKQVDNVTVYDTGNWVNGRRSGKGTMTWSSNLEEYSGEWNDGKRHGYGHMRMASKCTYNGQWTHDEMTGNGVLTYANMYPNFPNFTRVMLSKARPTDMVL